MYKRIKTPSICPKCLRTLTSKKFLELHLVRCEDHEKLAQFKRNKRKEIINKTLSQYTWKKHPVLDMYAVTTCGKVYSFFNYRFLKQSTNNAGYKMLCLSKEGKHYVKGVHRIVAETFIPNPKNLSDVNHIVPDKTNNDVSNLEWNTHKENVNNYWNDPNRTADRKRHIDALAKGRNEFWKDPERSASARKKISDHVKAYHKNKENK